MHDGRELLTPLVTPDGLIMIAKIIEYSARNKFIVVLLVFFLGIWGYWAMTKTPLDAIPDLSDTQVIIFTEWTGPQSGPGGGPDHLSDHLDACWPLPKSRPCAAFPIWGVPSSM